MGIRVSIFSFSKIPKNYQYKDICEVYFLYITLQISCSVMLKFNSRGLPGPMSDKSDEFFAGIQVCIIQILFFVSFQINGKCVLPKKIDKLGLAFCWESMQVIKYHSFIFHIGEIKEIIKVSNFAANSIEMNLTPIQYV